MAQTSLDIGVHPCHHRFYLIHSDTHASVLNVLQQGTTTLEVFFALGTPVVVWIMHGRVDVLHQGIPVGKMFAAHWAPSVHFGVAKVVDLNLTMH